MAMSVGSAHLIARIESVCNLSRTIQFSVFSKPLLDEGPCLAEPWRITGRGGTLSQESSVEG